MKMYGMLCTWMILLSCGHQKKYNEKILVFDKSWCIEKGTPIQCDGKTIGKITDFYPEGQNFIGKAKIEDSFHSYYSIIPYIQDHSGKCSIGFETKNATRHLQTDTIFATRQYLQYN